MLFLYEPMSKCVLQFGTLKEITSLCDCNFGVTFFFFSSLYCQTVTIGEIPSKSIVHFMRLKKYIYIALISYSLTCNP